MRNVVGVQELFLTFPHAGSKAGHLGDDALAVPELSGGPVWGTLVPPLAACFMTPASPGALHTSLANLRSNLYPTVPKPPKRAMSNVVSVQELFLTFPHAGSKAGHLGDDALTQSSLPPP